ncbi:MAG: hypothetical protein O3C27_09085 [Actinomycetota bacterium]|nr:hypothetical protein [Actinomycetota bacterium]
MDPPVSGAMWEAVERFHAACYLAPEVREEASAVGLKGFWMNYFATRVAPVGAVGPAIVESSFFYYSPARVQRAIPDAWRYASPEAVLAARYRGMDRALRRIYGRTLDDDSVAEAAELVRRAASGCDRIGRVLHAGWAALPWPEEAHLALWHGCTLLREYRSGSHLLAVCAEGLDGCESVVSHASVGGGPRDWIQGEAAWSADEEARAVASLQRRGWLDRAGAATAEGRAGRDRIEDLTNRADLPVWARLGAPSGRRLFDLLAELAIPLGADDQLDWRHHYPEAGS